jgi:hypothetical protein
MSAKVTGWVWDQDLLVQRKAVLLWLAERATDNGVCFPGQAEIRHKTGLSESMVRRHLRWLKSDGAADGRPRQPLLRVVERRVDADRNTSNVYIIRVPWARPEDVARAARDQACAGRGAAGGGGRWRRTALGPWCGHTATGRAGCRPRAGAGPLPRARCPARAADRGHPGPRAGHRRAAAGGRRHPGPTRRYVDRTGQGIGDPSPGAPPPSPGPPDARPGSPRGEQQAPEVAAPEKAWLRAVQARLEGAPDAG